MVTTPVFLPGKFHGQRSLAGYRPWVTKKSNTTQQLNNNMFPFTRHFLSLLSSLPFPTFKTITDTQIPSHCIFFWPKLSGRNTRMSVPWCLPGPPDNFKQRTAEIWPRSLCLVLGAGPKATSQLTLPPLHSISVGKEVYGDAPNGLAPRVRC